MVGRGISGIARVELIVFREIVINLGGKSEFLQEYINWPS